MTTKELFKETIARNIRNERIARNLSIDELAYLMDLTPGFMGLIERGRRGATAFNLYKLANVFNISVQRLITENNDYEKADENKNVSKKKKLASLSSQLDDKGLDFIIGVIKHMDVFRSNT